MSHVSGESTSSPARDEEEDEVKVFNHDDEEEDEINVQEVKEEVNKRQELLNEFKKGLIDENEKKTSSSSHHHHQGSSSTSTSNASTTQSSSSKSNSSLSSSALTPAFPSLYPFPPHPFHHHPNGSLESMIRSYPNFLELTPPFQSWRTSSMSPSLYPMSHAYSHHPGLLTAAFHRNTQQSLIPPYPPPPLAHSGHPLGHPALPQYLSHQKSTHDQLMAAMSASMVRGHHSLHSYSPLSHNASPLASYPSPLSSTHATPPPTSSSLLAGPFSSASSMVTSPLPHPDVKPNVHGSSLSHRVDSLLSNGNHSTSSSSSSSSNVNHNNNHHRRIITGSPVNSSATTASIIQDHIKSKSQSLVNGHHGHVNHNHNRVNAVNQNNSNNNTKNHPQSQNNNNHSNHHSPNSSSNNHNGPDMSHVKKPLNAFMMFMREQRSKVVAEHMLKESAAINQILGKMWHGLAREEQQKYFDMARKAKSDHHRLYPGWTARDNYAINQKKKKKKRDKSVDGDSNSQKKCRARYGLDQQASWCKPCRRKKKCIRYSEAEANLFNLGSVGSTDAKTPDSKNESDAEKSIHDVSVNDHHMKVDHHHSLHHHLNNGRRTTDSLPPGLLIHPPFYRSPA